MYSETKIEANLRIIQKRIGLYIALFTAIVLVSCEGMRIAEGTVYEKSTNQPLDSVLCKVLETGEELYTDSTGKFYLEGPFGGCMRECKDMTVEFSKNGYKTITILNPEQEIVYLEK